MPRGLDSEHRLIFFFKQSERNISTKEAPKRGDSLSSWKVLVGLKPLKDVNDTRSHPQGPLERYPTRHFTNSFCFGNCFLFGLCWVKFFFWGGDRNLSHIYVRKKSVPNALGFSHSRMLGLTPNAFTVAGRHLLDAHMHTQLLGLQTGP